jgi:capping protein beta
MFTTIDDRHFMKVAAAPVADPGAAGSDLLRHVDPKDIEDRVFDAIKLNPSTTDHLLCQVDVPLRVATDSAGNQFILCDFNRDGDSYRSPFTNAYVPPLAKGNQPPDHLREMEVMANRGFQSYLRQYFDSGVLSVYCWEADDDSFGIGVFVRKDIEAASRGPISGSISCGDVCEVKRVSRRKRKFQYLLASSAVVSISWRCRVGHSVTLTGSVADSHDIEKEAASPLDHLVTVGQMIEGNADRFVEKIRGIYASRMREILSYMKVDSHNQGAQAAQDFIADGLKAS